MKGGKIIVILLISFLIAILIVVGSLYYFYNYFVFKELRICIGGEGVDTKISCLDKSECIQVLEKELNFSIGDAPDFVKAAYKKLINEVAYCDKSCKIKNFRGVNLTSLEKIKSCNKDEKELLFKIRGKEIYEGYLYYKEVMKKLE